MTDAMRELAEELARLVVALLGLAWALAVIALGVALAALLAGWLVRGLVAL
jgi:anti-sigma factor RsiW